MRQSIIILIVFISFASCKRQSQSEMDKQKIEKYVADNNLIGQFTSSGLFYTIEVEGIGANPGLNNTVTCEYTGYLLNGNQFDGTSAGKPISFPLSQVIKGWQEGIPKYKKGGKGKLIIPSELGYGSRGVGTIPPNSVLVFDVYLVDFK